MKYSSSFLNSAVYIWPVLQNRAFTATTSLGVHLETVFVQLLQQHGRTYQSTGALHASNTHLQRGAGMQHSRARRRTPTAAAGIHAAAGLQAVRRRFGRYRLEEFSKHIFFGGLAAATGGAALGKRIPRAQAPCWLGSSAATRQRVRRHAARWPDDALRSAAARRRRCFSGVAALRAPQGISGCHARRLGRPCSGAISRRSWHRRRACLRVR
jgi:hypothetical protein